MSSIGDKKVALNLSDGTSVNLNKPIDIPSTVTDIVQITEPGWYHGEFTFLLHVPNGPDDPDIGGDESTMRNTPAMKIIGDLMHDETYNFDMFVTKTGDYIFNLARNLFYGVIDTSSSTTSINWEIVSPLVVDDLTSTSSNKALSANQGKVLKELIDKKLDNPTVSTSDLTAGTSDLPNGQIYLVYE